VGPFSLAEYWHRLSLDAPTIAFVWCCFFERTAHLQLPWFTPFLLALGTWIVYVADRLLDGLHSNGEKTLRERHRFYARHRLAFCLVLGAASLVCGGLTLTRMRHDVLTANALLAVFVCVYFALIHGAGRRVERWFPKELVVGCLFAIATALPTMMRVLEWRPGVEAGVALFACLCWLNCVAIESWESEGARSAECASTFGGPHFSTRWLGRHLSAAAVCAACVSALFAMLWTESFLGRVAVACFLGNACLALLDHFRLRISPAALRIAADISLLAPLLLLPWFARR
jgi:hypothetical protein